MRILLTGGSGMVGKNLQEHLKYMQFRFFAPSSRELNLLNYEAIKKFLAENRIEFIIHCAGLVGGIQANIKHPVEFLSHNLTIGLNLLNASKEYGIENLLNLGSSCMYPRDYLNPLKEEYILQAPLEPTNEGYALAKIAIAKLGEYITKEHGYNYKTLIPCNLYGRWDKFDDNHSHMIPAVIKKIYQASMSQLPIVDIWGDGSARREFMYAADCADAIFFAIENFARLPLYTNIGLGYDYSINEFYNNIAGIIGYTGIFEHDLTKPSGMQQKLISVNVMKELGWVANTSLIQGLTETYNFYLSKIV